MVPPKKRKRNAYLSPCSECLHADTSVNQKKVKVQRLKNGNQPVKCGKSRVSVLNTCAFDALCQSLCCAFCDSLSFPNIVCSNESDNQFLKLLKAIATQGVTQQVYVQRVLRAIFKAVQLKSGADRVDAQRHISAVLERTMRGLPSVYLSSVPHSTAISANKPNGKLCLFPRPLLSCRLLAWLILGLLWNEDSAFLNLPA